MSMSETESVEVIKCTCGAGDTRTLNMLRATTLANLGVDEYNEIVGAVNKAGGIVKTVGIWRLLLAKAAEEYTQGVLKGDFVGHPFRGNQHSSASGASTGGASASGGVKGGGKKQPKRPTVEEVRSKGGSVADMFEETSTPEIEEKRKFINEQQNLLQLISSTLSPSQTKTDSEDSVKATIRDAKAELVRLENKAVGADLIAQGEKASQAKLKGEAVSYATEFVRSQIESIIEDDEMSLKHDEAGVGNLRRAAEEDAQNAVMQAEFVRESGNDSESKKEARALDRRAQAKDDLAESLNETQKDLNEARQALVATRAKASKETNPRNVGAILSEGVRQAIGILEIRAQKLKSESEAARANDKAGRGGGTGVQYGLPLSALADRIAGLRGIDSDSRGLNSDVDEMLKNPDFVAEFSD